MSMRYFTLSAVCMLVFCMLLALSGTTDSPGEHPGIASESGVVSPPPASREPAKGAAMASVYPLRYGEEPPAGGESGRVDMATVPRDHRLLLLGAGFILAWVLLSFRLLARSRR